MRHAALVLACLALALSIYVALRAPGAAPAGPCVDPEARAQVDQLRRALAERDALVARLASRVDAAAGIGPAAGAGPAAEPSSPSPPSEPAPGAAPRRYARFESPNHAVSVTQKPDGSYDIRTTDPALAGSILQITAITESGEQDKVLIRIPP